MSQVKTILQKMGLTDTEIEIYLRGLSYDSIGVKELEKTTRINRTTIYHALNTLIQKGLASKRESGTGAKLIFSMTSPENIKKFFDREIRLLQERKQEIESVIPLLLDRVKQKEDTFKVSHFEGIEGIKLVVEEALYCRSRQWNIIAPKKNFFSEFDSSYARYYLKTRKENNIQSRSLWEYVSDAKSLTPEDMRERNPRYLPKIMQGRFQSVIIIFDDKVAFITSIKNISAVLIQSNEINETMSAMFEGLWVGSKELRK
ncbi:MAG: helix-turn-helix domain-containing protein [Candidatus Moraniibacteriota bacterium]